MKNAIICTIIVSFKWGTKMAPKTGKAITILIGDMNLVYAQE